jgi:hypothetical protein
MTMKDPVMSNPTDSPSHPPSSPRPRSDREDPSWDYGDPFEAARVIWTGTGADAPVPPTDAGRSS